MANDESSESDDRDLFLEYLLRSALTAPNAATSPTAGRILARLLVVGAIEGGDALVTPYLVPTPGEDATFDVRAYRPGNLTPTEVREGMGAATALKMALRAARDGDDGIEVVSRSESGLERCVLVRDSTGDFEFRFASGETLAGHPIECAAARRAWTLTLASWRAWVGREHPDSDPVFSGPTEIRSAIPSNGQRDGGRDTPVSEGWWGTNPDGQDHELETESREVQADQSNRPPARWGPGGELADQMEAAGFEDTPPIEPGGGEAEDRTGRPGTGTGRLEDAGIEPAAADRQPPLGPKSRLFRPKAEAETMIDAVQEALDNLTVDVDLSQVEPLIRRALDSDRHELLEPLARRLSIRLSESLELPNTRDFVDALLPLIPRPGEVAEAVAADIGALLSETILRRRGDVGVGTGIEGPGVLAAVESIQVQLDGLRDQFRRTTDVLSGMGDRIEASDRRAAVAERVTTSIDQEMHRLANRIDEQVTELASSAGGGSELADGVARLTRKLRQSVDQLDRALVRLNALVDEPGSDQPTFDRPRSDQPRSDGSGFDQVASDYSGSDGSGSVQPGSDQPGSDQPGSDQPGSDQPGSVQPGSHQPVPDDAGSDQSVTRRLGTGRRSAVGARSLGDGGRTRAPGWTGQR